MEEKEKPKMGRPLKEINWSEFEKLCALQCTEIEVAGWFDMTAETLNQKCKGHYGSTFLEVSKQKKQPGKVSLRRTLWKQAEKSPACAIWLSKQHLGMTDKVEADVATSHTFNIQVEDYEDNQEG